MPLLDGREVELVPPPKMLESGENARMQTWRIRFTNETFDDYDKYLERLLFYRKPIWTCSESGRCVLTFEQALMSERAERHRNSGIGFSDPLIHNMLLFISQSTLSISLAVDALFYRFQHDFYIGEHIDVKYPGTNGSMYECFVVGIGGLPRKPAFGVFDEHHNEPLSDQAGQQVLFSHSMRTAIERLGEAAENVIAVEQRKSRMYTVRLIDMEGNPIDDSDISVPATELSRSRNVFTKVALRQFLDEYTERSPGTGSPWIVRPEFRNWFHIPFTHQGDAQLLMGPIRSAKRGHGPMVFDDVAFGHPAKRMGSSSPGQYHRRVDGASSPLSPALEHMRLNADFGAHSQASRISEMQMYAHQHIAPPRVIADPRAEERHLKIRHFRKFPIEDLDYIQYNHIKCNQGTLWALRRKAHGIDVASKKNTITNYFASSKERNDNKPGAERSESNQEDEKEENNGEEEEEEEEALKNRWPVPLVEWQVPVDKVSRMLAVYMFISYFSGPLCLSPFPLDHFESVLVYKTPTAPSESKHADPKEHAAIGAILRETYIALLNSIVSDRAAGSLPTNVSARIEAMHEHQNGNVTEDEEEKVDEEMAGPKGEASDREPAENIEETPIEDVEEKPVEDTESMEIDKPSSRNPTNGAPLPPAPKLGARSAKLNANRSIAHQSDFLQGNISHIGYSHATRSRNRSRLHHSSTLSASSSVSSLDSASDSDSGRNGRKGGKRTKGTAGRRLNGTRSRSRGNTPSFTDQSSDVDETASNGTAEPDETQQNGEKSQLEAMRPHALLRHLALNWGTQRITRTAWAHALVGWLIEASYDYPELSSLRDTLWADDELKHTTLEARLANALDFDARLTLLELLVGECTNNEAVRKYVDSCAESTAELKRERIEVRKELKRVTEEIAQLDREDVASKPKDAQTGDSEPANEPQSESDQSSNGMVQSREQAREEKRREKERTREMRKLGESERHHQKRLDHIERELRRNNIGRLTPIGYDRYYTRYYYLDGIGGCAPSAGFGRILVQPISPTEQKEVVQGLPKFVLNTWTLEIPGPWRGTVVVDEDDEHKKLLDLAFAPGDSHALPPAGELWGYYTTPTQLEALKRWLDAKGRRESALLDRLNLLSAAIGSSLRKRCQALERAHDARERARKLVCEQINTHLDSLDDNGTADPIVEQLQRELDALDPALTPRALVPPALLLRQDESDAALTNNNNASSRASSTEPQSPADAQQRKWTSPRAGTRGRKKGERQNKKYVEAFLAYENTLFV